MDKDVNDLFGESAENMLAFVKAELRDKLLFLQRRHDGPPEVSSWIVASVL